jgi:phenylacetate-CoA ligase
MTSRATTTGSPRASLSTRLADLLRGIVPSNAFYSRKLREAGFDPGSLRGDEPVESILARLPFTTKADFQEDQESHPPFGTNLTFPLDRYTRIHHTSGTTGRPLWWLDTPESWSWFAALWDESYRGAGVTPRDRVFFPFSFGPFVGFWAGFESACRMGALAVPGGGLGTGARLRVLRETGATVVAATPTYALRLAEEARAEGMDLAAAGVRAVIVAGEPGGCIPETRARIESAWGARCFDHAGMTEVGAFGFDCGADPPGLHINDEEFAVEVVDPHTLRPVPDGAEGELVITNLGRTGSPAIRYRSGDIVRLTREPCACGRKSARLRGGILARMDEMIFVRGNNVYPSAVEAIIRRFPEIEEFRVRAVRAAEMTELVIEIEPAAPGGGPAAEALGRRVAAALETTLLFRSGVRVVPPGSLPRFELKGRRFIKE